MYRLTSLVTEFVAQHTILHPSNRDQIIERLEQAVSHPVFGHAVNARIMSDRHLGHRKSVHQGQRGEEPVHALKEPDAFQYGAPKDLEWASRIMDTVMSEKVSHRVRDPGGDHLHEAVLSLLPPSADQVVGRGVRQQLQDVLAVLLEIAVNLDNDLAQRLPKAGIQRAGLAIIAVEVKHPHLRMRAGQAVQLVAAAVAAAIVNEENFVWARARQLVGIHDFQETCNERRQVLPFILDGDDDRGPRIGIRAGWRCHDT
jgi:hypothetical protein